MTTATGKHVRRARVNSPERIPQVQAVRAISGPHVKWYLLLAVVWLAVNGEYWAWWLSLAHTGNLALFTMVSLAMFYVFTFLPSAYLFFLGCIRYPVHVDAVPENIHGVVGRVAIITPTVPGSESLDIVRRQMLAMREVRYPHDNWVLVDAEHSPEIAALAAEIGVNYFSRHDIDRWGEEQVSRWNQPKGLLAAKTKSGNVNSWLSQYGGFYSHFTQLDIDHSPIPSYLDRVLGYFSDPAVAYVQAPSIYGNHEYWTARGASEQELVLQGPLQMGFFGFSRTPFIIGSHCTYDMNAIKSIGGFQPTRAEDHLDTVCLAGQDYEGIYVPEIIAVGDGPEDFATYLSQQFAWAYSMIQVLLTYTPRLIWKYTPRRAFQFLFVQTWYTFWSLSMLILFIAPLITLTTNQPITSAGYWNFLAHFLPISVASFGTWLWSRRWHFPQGLRLSWRGVVLHVARWLIVLSALVQVIMRVKKPYMVTIKGIGDGSSKFPFGLLAPYIGLIGLSLGSCWYYIDVYGSGKSQGYLFFALKGALLFWLMLVALLAIDLYSLRNSALSIRQVIRARVMAIVTVLVITALFALTADYSMPLILQAILH